MIRRGWQYIPKQSDGGQAWFNNPKAGDRRMKGCHMFTWAASNDLLLFGDLEELMRETRAPAQVQEPMLSQHMQAHIKDLQDNLRQRVGNSQLASCIMRKASCVHEPDLQEEGAPPSKMQKPNTGGRAGGASGERGRGRGRGSTEQEDGGLPFMSTGIPSNMGLPTDNSGGHELEFDLLLTPEQLGRLQSCE
jgi:hypothetical protein